MGTRAAVADQGVVLANLRKLHSLAKGGQADPEEVGRRAAAATKGLAKDLEGLSEEQADKAWEAWEVLEDLRRWVARHSR